MSACGSDDESEPGLETGPCLSGSQCAAGLQCASEVCVDLDGSDDGGEGSTPDSPTPTDDSDLTTSGAADDGTDMGMDSADAGDADGADDPGADPPPPTDDAAEGGGAAWCPVPPSALNCTTACDLFQFECYECPQEPGDLCVYYDHQYDACLTGCEYSKTIPDDFTYEVFACRQYAGNDCGDADVDCLLEIDCAGA